MATFMIDTALDANQTIVFTAIRKQIGMGSANSSMKKSVMIAIMDRVGLAGSATIARGFTRAINAGWLADHEIKVIRAMRPWDYLRLIVKCADASTHGHDVTEIEAGEWIVNHMMK